MAATQASETWVERSETRGSDGVWCITKYASSRPLLTMALMPTAAPYRYVYVNTDGTARELHASERRYLETPFKGGDGAAPYLKSSYDQRNGWGELAGYLERSRLPDGIAVSDPPADDPMRAMSKDETIAWLRQKGMDVTENRDGSLSIHRRRR